MIDAQLNEAIETARAAAARGDYGSAAQAQERVVAHIRLLARSPDELVTLSVQMFNLADYYTGAERFSEAISLLEQVVAFDEKLDLPDTESDRQMLAQVRKLSGMTAAERDKFYADTPASPATITGGPDDLTALLDQLDGVADVNRTELEALVRELSSLPPEEQVRRVLELRGNKPLS